MHVKTSFQIIQADSQVTTNAFELIFQNEGAQVVKIFEHGEGDGFTLNPPEVSGGISIPQRLRLTVPPGCEEIGFFQVSFSGSGAKRLVVIKRRIA